jgi:hypothetical protein
MYCLEGPVEPEYSPAEDFMGVNWEVNVTEFRQIELGVLNELVDNMRVGLLQKFNALNLHQRLFEKK